MEREHWKDDVDPNCGTVNAERLEQYLIDYVVPVLGKAELKEPNSIWGVQESFQEALLQRIS